MASIIKLSEGSVSAMYNNQNFPSPLVQILELKKVQGQNNQANQERYKLSISDGVHSLQAMLASQLHNLVKEQTIDVGCVVRLNDYLCNAVHGRKIAFILNLEVVSPPIQVIGNPVNIEGGQPPAATHQNQPPPTAQPMRPQQQPPQQQYRPPQQNFGQQQQNAYQQQPQRPAQTYAAPQQQNTFQQQQRPLDSSVYPIKSLNPYQNRWTIKARVTHKSEMKTFTSAKGQPGNLFSVDLLDSNGEIRATMFNDAATSFYPILEVDKIYYISKGKLKPANKKFSSLKNEYELTLDSDSIIQLCADEATDIPRNRFAFTSIDNILGHQKDDVIDVVGVVLSMEDVGSITTKTAKQLAKRNITIVDTSFKSIELTLWGAQAENPGFAGYDHPVLAVKGAKVSEFKNRTLTAVSSTLIEVNPDLPQAHALREWYDAQGDSIISNVTSLSSNTGNGSTFSGEGSSRKIAERVTFGHIKDQSLGRGQQDEFSVKGTVTLIKHENDVWYKACAKCGKKVNESDGQWKCDKCNEVKSSYEPRYMLSLSAADHTGSAWMNAFNDVGKNILGKTAPEMENLKLQAPGNYESVFQQAFFKQYIFHVRAKVETYNGVDRVRCNAFRVSPVSFAEESRSLIQQIQRFG